MVIGRERKVVVCRFSIRFQDFWRVQIPENSNHCETPQRL